MRTSNFLFLLALLFSVGVLAQSNPFGVDNSLPTGAGGGNDPPVWNNTPSISCIEGFASSISLVPSHVSDPESDTLTLTSEGTAFPTGVTLDDANDEIDCGTGTSTGTTNGVIIGANDGTNPKVNSSSFTITVSNLTYQEGGAPGDIEDPALDVDAANRRYVCDSGSDSNDGLTQGAAWATINKISAKWSTIPSNSIIVLCRGGSWGSQNITNKAGTTDAPTAIGAYGACTASTHFDNVCSNAPRINGTMQLNQSSWITLRDLSAKQFDTSGGSNHLLLYRNQAWGGVSNVFRTFGVSHNLVFVENIATDASSNDYFVLHRTGANNVRDSHWLIDNICIGSGGEDCIDLAMARIDAGDDFIPQDVKVIANRAVDGAISGFSTLTGSANRCHNSGHYGKYFWFVGNICMGFPSDSTWNFSRLNNKDGAWISGNVIIGDVSGGEMFRNFAPNQDMNHNTLLQDGSSGECAIMQSANQRFDYNLCINKSGTMVKTDTPDNDILSFDHNWYGLSTGNIITDGETLTERQANTSFDQNSDEGAVTGLTIPTSSTYPNPTDWRDASFLAEITPSGSWGGCAGSNTPGARDCTGNWIWTLEPITGAANSGCGWGGLPIVAVKLDALGVTGTCVP